MKRMIFFVLALMMANAAALDLSVNVTNSCNISISIFTEKENYSSGETVKYLPKLNQEPKNYSIAYWIEDAGGSILKKPVSTSNQLQKSYTAKRPASILLKARITHTSCNDYMKNDNFANKTLVLESRSDPANSGTVKKPITTKNWLIGGAILLLAAICAAVIWRK